ncbi:MAG: hypothetical protein C4536_05735 [Actinobacteria bacterium]|jgi:hypothetical protein|nr:MAG: hypothetical protein C4536_05735 [Actinomycetota bacterium]
MLRKVGSGPEVRTGFRDEPQLPAPHGEGRRIKKAYRMNDDKVVVDFLAGDGTKESWIIGVRGGSAYNHTLYAATRKERRVIT